MSDLQNVITNLQSIIEQLNAEKIALDEAYVDKLKEAIHLRKELILLKGLFQKERTEKEKLQVQLNDLLKENNCANKEEEVILT